MSSVKECFSKGIGYIKREINLYEEERDEIMEFIGYHEGMQKTPLIRARLNKEWRKVTEIDEQLVRLKRDLAYYKTYFRYTDAEIEAIPAATEESLRRDEQIELLELKHNTWTIDDTREVFKKAGITIN